MAKVLEFENEMAELPSGDYVVSMREYNGELYVATNKCVYRLNTNNMKLYPLEFMYDL